MADLSQEFESVLSLTAGAITVDLGATTEDWDGERLQPVAAHSTATASSWLGCKTLPPSNNLTARTKTRDIRHYQQAGICQASGGIASSGTYDWYRHYHESDWSKFCNPHILTHRYNASESRVRCAILDAISSIGLFSWIATVRCFERIGRYENTPI